MQDQPLQNFEPKPYHSSNQKYKMVLQVYST